VPTTGSTIAFGTSFALLDTPVNGERDVYLVGTSDPAGRIDWIRFDAPDNVLDAVAVGASGTAVEIDLAEGEAPVVGLAGINAVRADVRGTGVPPTLAVDGPGGAIGATLFSFDGEVAVWTLEGALPKGRAELTFGLGDFRFATRELDVLPGDANGDGRVDLADFGILRSNFGSLFAGGPAAGDFDGDGDVDLADFGLLRARFGDEL